MLRQKFHSVLNYHKNQLLFLLATWGTFFTYVFANMVSLRKEGLFLGHPNAWSDWAHHIAIANIFAFKDSQFWFSYHPIFSDGKFTYPFLMDFISGILMRIGLSLPLSFIAPSIIFSIVLVFSLYFLGYLISNSKIKSILAVNIFFLSSGLGFINFLSDFLSKPQLTTFLYPAKEYSEFIEYEWYTGSVIAGILIPQRGFLLGFCIGLISLILLLYPLLRKVSKKTKIVLFVLAGLFAGILPIAHAHSFIVLVILGGLVVAGNFKKNPQVLIFVFIAGLLSSFLYLIFIHGGIQNESFFRFFPGWSAKDFPDFIRMWTLLWGPVILMSILGFISVFRKIPIALKMLFFGFFLIFALSNLFLFQPIVWDNTKLFWWVYIGFSILSAIALSKLYQRSFSGRVLAYFLLTTIIFTGIIEVIKISDLPKNTYILTPTEDINLGIKIREETKPVDIFATAPTHNSLIMMWAARPILLGYTAWVYNFGFEYEETEADLEKIYKGGEDVKRLLEKYNVSYVLIGPAERNHFTVDEKFFENNFPVAFSNSNNKIYKIN